MAPIEILLLILLILAAVVIGRKVWLKRSKKERSHKKSRRIFRSKHFMKLINQGFRVYDVYYLQEHFQQLGCNDGGYGRTLIPVKFSILSKKKITKENALMLVEVPGGYDGVLKNTKATRCRYVTYDGKSVYEYNKRLCVMKRVRTVIARKCSGDEYEVAKSV